MNSTIYSFNGLYLSIPMLAFITIVTMLSLAGIPALSGFFAKYYIFTAALQQGFIWLVIIAVIGSLIGVYYYFRIIIAVLKTEESITVKINPVSKFVLLLTSVAILLAGIFPEYLATLLQ
jgi:NADH-quinone oxidoreductase subunit N